ncbi:MAG: hypothetical protein M3081_17920, partial [Gemmatimonadota bacterium]|nr:hypothetical protein [Gemmatimonadota bacterium]
RAGARLVTDDTLAVTIGARPQLLPGVHAVRLFADSASHLGEVERVEGLTVMSEKHVIIPTGSIVAEPVAFAAAYVLRPVTHLQSGAAVERILLSKREAVTLFLGHSKIQNLFDGVERMAILDRASVLTELVPAYRLDIVRDLARLSEVTDVMARWHAEVVAPGQPA